MIWIKKRAKKAGCHGCFTYLGEISGNFTLVATHWKGLVEPDSRSPSSQGRLLQVRPCMRPCQAEGRIAVQLHVACGRGNAARLMLAHHELEHLFWKTSGVSGRKRSLPADSGRMVASLPSSDTVWSWSNLQGSRSTSLPGLDSICAASMGGGSSSCQYHNAAWSNRMMRAPNMSSTQEACPQLAQPAYQSTTCCTFGSHSSTCQAGPVSHI